MHYLNPVDAAFLRMESARSPMHVGALMRFRLPDDAPPDFLQRLLKRMSEHFADLRLSPKASHTRHHPPKLGGIRVPLRRLTLPKTTKEDQRREVKNEFEADKP